MQISCNTWPWLHLLPDKNICYGHVAESNRRVQPMEINKKSLSIHEGHADKCWWHKQEWERKYLKYRCFHIFIRLDWTSRCKRRTQCAVCLLCVQKMDKFNIFILFAKIFHVVQCSPLIRKLNRRRSKKYCARIIWPTLMKWFSWIMARCRHIVSIGALSA